MSQPRGNRERNDLARPAGLTMSRLDSRPRRANRVGWLGHGLAPFCLASSVAAVQLGWVPRFCAIWSFNREGYTIRHARQLPVGGSKCDLRVVNGACQACIGNGNCWLPGTLEITPSH